MKLGEFANLILFGTTLDEKLIQTSLSPSTAEFPAAKPLIEIPTFPGRPHNLSRPGKATFPSIHKLHELTERGRVLHFFANHELLALELMALVLLRFPEAPPSFRMGLARIMQEEQSHLRLYLFRMKELGVEFGDLPVSDYFWNRLKNTKSLMEFTVQMSLTFEQANLDFSLFFMNAVKRVGDLQTAAILERVFTEEIGHVKHGLNWFNRWRENSSQETDWDAYLRLLPAPLTAQRAKGFEFADEARRKAGFSETYIRELRIYSGSKGRPPVLWIYNPHCDSEIARGKPGFTPTEGAKQLSDDLESLPLFLCQEQDTVLLKNRPRTEWIESLYQAGFRIPNFCMLKNLDLTTAIRTPKIGGMQPWGWSPEVFQAFQPLKERLVHTSGGNSEFCEKLLSHSKYEETGLGKLFSKVWSVQFLKEWIQTQHFSRADQVNQASLDFFGDHNWVGEVFNDWSASVEKIQTLFLQGHSVMLKAPYGTSGMQVRRIKKFDELNGPLGGWLRNTLAEQGAIIIEPWLNKVCDLSIQIEIMKEKTELLEVRQFVTGKQNEYKGTYLGTRLPALAQSHTHSGDLKFFHAALLEWNKLLLDLGAKLRQEGYFGPAGVDALLWKDKNGSLKLKPLVELNPRWTMGRVALELEKRLLPGVTGFWQFISIREIQRQGFANALEYAQYLQRKHPLVITRSKRIQSGVVFTNDPASARAILTVLQVGLVL